MQAIKHASMGIHPGFEMSPEVQNRGISGPTKRTDVLQQFFLKKLTKLLNFNMLAVI